MRWFWSVTCISLRTMTAWLHCVISIGSSGGWFMFVGVCVCVRCIYIFVCVCVCVWICLPSPKQPKSTQTDIIFTLLSEFLFFFLSDVYLQAENQGLSYCMFTFHLFIVNTGKRGRKRSQNKKCTQTCSEIHRLSGSRFKLCFLHWQQKKEGSIILASMLWSQNTDTVILFVLFSLLFSFCSFVLDVKSQSFYTLTTCVCPSTEKR